MRFLPRKAILVLLLFLTWVTQPLVLAGSSPLLFFPWDSDDYQKNTGSLGGAVEVISPMGAAPETYRWERGVALRLPTSAQGNKGAHLVYPHTIAELRLAGPDDQLTIACWVRWDGPAKGNEKFQGIVSTASNGLRSGWALGINRDDQKLVFLWGIRSGSTVRFSEIPISEGEWTHVAVVWDNADETGLKFYLDGKPVRPFQLGKPLLYKGKGGIIANDNPLRIGMFGKTSGPLNGSLSQLRIYDTALSDESIAHLAEGAP